MALRLLPKHSSAAAWLACSLNGAIECRRYMPHMFGAMDEGSDS